jgi:photosystem II stability/assembly factor-like uncharacterized protein
MTAPIGQRLSAEGSRSPRANGNSRRFARKLHRLVGVAVSLFLLSLAVTGFLLNHPAWLGAPAERTLSLAADPTDPDRLFRGTRSCLFVSNDGGVTWDEVNMMIPLEHVVDVAFEPGAPATVYAVGRDQGVIRSTDGGYVWESVPIGFVPAAEGVHLERIAVGTGADIRLWTSSGLRASDDGGQTWVGVGETTAEVGDLRTLVHQVHTGYIFGRGMVFAHDVAAVGTVGLIVTGLVIWRRRNGRAR